MSSKRPISHSPSKAPETLFSRRVQSLSTLCIDGDLSVDCHACRSSMLVSTSSIPTSGVDFTPSNSPQSSDPKPLE